MRIIKVEFFFSVFLLLLISLTDSFGELNKSQVSPSGNEANSTLLKQEVIRVIKPGVFDYQSQDYMVRMRVWGVEFPKREQPGYNEALTFSEQKLLSVSPEIQIRQEFDLQNLKVVEVTIMNGQMNFSRGGNFAWNWLAFRKRIEPLRSFCNRSAKSEKIKFRNLG